MPIPQPAADLLNGASAAAVPMGHRLAKAERYVYMMAVIGLLNVNAAV